MNKKSALGALLALFFAPCALFCVLALLITLKPHLIVLAAFFGGIALVGASWAADDRKVFQRLVGLFTKGGHK